MTPKELEKAARAALETITPTDSIGPMMSTDESDGIANVRFGSNLPGYVGWEWVASLAIDGATTTILETELVAGDESIRAPEWVPWADRLREYEASLAAGAEDAVVVVPDDAIDDDELDDDEVDDDDMDEDLDDDEDEDEYVVVDDD